MHSSKLCFDAGEMGVGVEEGGGRMMRDTNFDLEKQILH